MKRIAILGSTGSIGTQSLELIQTHSEDFKVVALTCGHNINLFREQLKIFSPLVAACADENDCKVLASEFPGISFACGNDGICAVASFSDADIVINSLLGMMGLAPTLAAIEAGKTIAFANKETLVAGGNFIMDKVKAKGISFLPVDSEHSAIFQSIQGAGDNRIKKIILTASGGPFRGYTKEQLENVSLEQALKHPNWSMGAKITVDSATMMNKGLEVIEASQLFGVDPSDIQVVVHPESALHSAVEFDDGAVIGQLGIPDMKIPIAYALSYPKRMNNVCKGIDLFELGTMHFEKPDLSVFRCLGLAFDAIKAGHSHQIVMNAANEVAVAAFLKEQIKFTEIPMLIDAALSNHVSVKISSVEQILELDSKTREYTHLLLRQQ